MSRYDKRHEVSQQQGDIFEAREIAKRNNTDPSEEYLELLKRKYYSTKLHKRRRIK